MSLKGSGYDSTDRDAVNHANLACLEEKLAGKIPAGQVIVVKARV
jgi:hypothetical protein